MALPTPRMSVFSIKMCSSSVIAPLNFFGVFEIVWCYFKDIKQSVKPFSSNYSSAPSLKASSSTSNREAAPICKSL